MVDGGIVTNTPISHVVGLGARGIYALPTDDPAARALPRGALEAAVHAFTVHVKARMYADLDRYADSGELIVLPALNRRYVGPSDFGHASALTGAVHPPSVAMLGAEARMEPRAAYVRSQ